MDIDRIIRAADEYRSAAGKLTALEEKISMLQVEENDEDMINKSRTCNRTLNRQKQRLQEMADDLESIALNWGRILPDGPGFHEEAASGIKEFGESRFENLSEYEELIPIHKA